LSSDETLEVCCPRRHPLAIDGVLFEAFDAPKDIQQEIIGRLKIRDR
jgi:hypothetical protein